MKRCPLCQTPVWDPEPGKEGPSQPDAMPRQHRESALPGAVALTVVCAAAGILISIVAETPVGSTVVAVDIAAFGLFCLLGKLKKA